LPAKIEALLKEALSMANAAFSKPLQPSAELSAIVGPEPLPRTEVVKKAKR